MARLDVLEFTPGEPRITVSLKLARCAFASFPVNTSNCTDDHYTPSLQVDYAGLQTFFREITATMVWARKQIERLDFSPQSDVSLSFVITASESNLSSYVSSGIIAALNSFSLLRFELARDLQTFCPVLEKGKINFLGKNSLFVPIRRGFSAKLVTQQCPEGRETDENGFLCGEYS